MEDLMVAIETAPEPQKAYLKQLFKNIPIYNRSCHTVKIKANIKFISLNEPCDSIWILIDGNVTAIKEQISGDVYVFTEFTAPGFFGEMEGFAGESYLKATLVTTTECRFIIMPINNYLNWIRHDSEALFLRVHDMMSGVLDESANERTYLFLDGVHRLMIYLIQYYKKHVKEKICIMEIKRQQIADEIGYSSKTVNRSIRKLLDNGLITIDGRKIVISEKQHQQLLELSDKNTNN